MNYQPCYQSLYSSGELKRRIQQAVAWIDPCILCPRECRAHRLHGEKGFCGAGRTLKVAAYHPHFGEEKELVGQGGSGTIFFSHCSLKCIFCINWDISHEERGYAISIEELANIMLNLQAIGTHNINLVTPTHYMPWILQALELAIPKGLNLPIVYNTFGWEKKEILQVLDGIIDIYLPDFKYMDEQLAKRCSPGVKDYPGITQQAVLEMHRQVGVALPNKQGLITRGLMIRHLVMPNQVSNSRRFLEWVAAHLPLTTYLNIMDQYIPVYKASLDPTLARQITWSEYQEVLSYAHQLGLTNISIR